MSRKTAYFAVMVDARDENAHNFYTDFGFIPNTVKRLFMPMQTIEKLFPGALWRFLECFTISDKESLP